MPTLILHGEDDQFVPVGDTAMSSSKMIKGAVLKVFPGALHGICTAMKDIINADLLTFISGKQLAGSSTPSSMAA